MKKILLFTLFSIITTSVSAQIRAELAVTKSVTDRDSTDGEFSLSIKTASMMYIQSQTIVGTPHLLQQAMDAKAKRFLVEYEIIPHQNHVSILKITLLASADKKGNTTGENIVLYDASTSNDY